MHHCLTLLNSWGRPAQGFAWEGDAFCGEGVEGGALVCPNTVAAAMGFQWSVPARKTSGRNCAASEEVSWCDQGTRVVGEAPGPVELDSA
jgi:hypothetical protein